MSSAFRLRRTDRFTSASRSMRHCCRSPSKSSATGAGFLARVFRTETASTARSMSFSNETISARTASESCWLKTQRASTGSKSWKRYRLGFRRAHQKASHQKPVSSPRRYGARGEWQGSWRRGIDLYRQRCLKRGTSPPKSPAFLPVIHPKSVGRYRKTMELIDIGKSATGPVPFRQSRMFLSI
jgi:hypothetical protein